VPDEAATANQHTNDAYSKAEDREYWLLTSSSWQVVQITHAKQSKQASKHHDQ